jgi:hypothetical protein
MSVNLQVEISVTALDDSGAPVTPPVYDSKTKITADTSSRIQITIPGKSQGYEVYVEAGSQNWLKLFAISPDSESFPAGLSFVPGDSENQGNSVTLNGPVAYFSPDALAGLFTNISELEKICFTNKSTCDVPLTIYYIRDVAKKTQMDTCPPKKGS